MTGQTVLTVSLALVLLLCCHGGEARVRLNSIRTVILREGHALPLNRSTWEPSLDLTVSAYDLTSWVLFISPHLSVQFEKTELYWHIATCINAQFAVG